MSKKLATLTLGLLILGTSFADEPVVRVQSISKAAESGSTLLVQKRPGDTKGFPVTMNCTGYVKDHYITDANTVAALEFLIGGRVGINKNTDIEIVNERSAADKSATKRVILKSGSLWVKADAKALKQPLEIQTNGGVMGIKGTEFTVETQADGSDRVCCFESNSAQGGVEIRDKSGKVVGTAKPGDEYQTSLKAAPIVTPHSDVEAFRTQTLDRGFNELYRSPWGQIGMGAIGYFAPHIGSGLSLASGLAYNGMALANCQKDPAGAALAALNLANAAGANTGAAGSYIGWGASIYNATKSNEPPKLEYPSDLAPDASPDSKQTKEANSYPQLSWKGVEDANAYAVMLAKDEDLNEVVFMEQTRDTRAVYPSAMRPLPAGKYYWRVIPLDGEDHPTKTAAQTYFTVK